MAKSRGLEAALEQVKAIQGLESLEPQDVEALRKIVKGKQSFAIAPATKLIVKHYGDMAADNESSQPAWR